jgi:transposase
MIMNNDAVVIKPYSLSELAEIYGVSTHTMKNWIRRHENSIGERVGRFYTTLQVKTIFQKLGLSDSMEE